MENKQLVLKVDDCGWEEYERKDVDRIVRICDSNGYEINGHTAWLAWERYSEEYYAAGWITMRDMSDEQVMEAVLSITMLGSLVNE